jgi:hypothetical protein
VAVTHAVSRGQLGKAMRCGDDQFGFSLASDNKAT